MLCISELRRFRSAFQVFCGGIILSSIKETIVGSIVEIDAFTLVIEEVKWLESGQPNI